MRWLHLRQHRVDVLSEKLGVLAALQHVVEAQGYAREGGKLLMGYIVDAEGVLAPVALGSEQVG